MWDQVIRNVYAYEHIHINIALQVHGRRRVLIDNWMVHRLLLLLENMADSGTLIEGSNKNGYGGDGSSGRSARGGGHGWLIGTTALGFLLVGLVAVVGHFGW